MLGLDISLMKWLTVFCLVLLVPVTAYTPDARWGQSSVLVGTTLYVYGGRSDPSNMYSYSSAPNNNELVSLDLSSTFPLSDVPWSCISGSRVSPSNQGPAVVFHSLTPFNSTTLLLFGGDGGPNMALPARPDSAWFLDVSSSAAPVWAQKPENWANEPVRSIYHAAVGSFGRVWITGGEKADGSMLPASGHYVFQPSVPSFDQLPTEGAPPIVSGHASVLLPSGVMLVFGGYNPTTNVIADMGTIWMVDTSMPVPAWSNVTATGAIPTGRHSFAYTALEGSKVFIHGGIDAGTRVVCSDAAILDTSQNPMAWSALSGFDEIGARRDHMAVGVGQQVLIGFGYGANGPASSSLLIYEAENNAWGSSFIPVSIPVPSPSSPAPPVASPTSSPQAIPPDQATSSQPTLQPTSASSSAPAPAPAPVIPGPIPTRSQPTTRHGFSPSGAAPTATLPPGSQDGPSSKLKTIAISAVLGALALVSLIVCIGCVALRRRRSHWKRGDGTARLIGPEPSATASDEGYGANPEKGAPMAGSNWGTFQSPRRQWTLLGLGSRQHHGRERFDILHDEDVRDFGDVRTSQASVRQETSEASARTTWGGILDASSASIRSVGAALGLGHVGRQLSYGSNHPSRRELEDMEKNASNPFLDASESGGVPTVPTVALVGASRPRATRQESSSSLPERTYRDPFEDPSEYPLMPFEVSSPERTRSPQEGENLVGAFRQQDLEDHGHYDDTIISPTLETYGLAALGRTRSNSDAAPSDESAGAGNTGPSGSGTAHGSVSSHEYRSIGLLSTMPSAPIKRSDSWWSRFSKGSLRGDRGAYQEGFNIVRKLSRQSDRPSRAEAFLDFRDPNPPPPLHPMAPIKETSHGSEPSADEVVGGPSRLSTANGLTGDAHRRSASSLVTVQTADSSALERIGQMDIIQRMRTGSTHHRQSLSLETTTESTEEPESSGFVPRRPRLSIVPGSPVGSPRATSESYRESRPSTPSLSEDHGTLVASPTELSSSIGHSPAKTTTPVRTRQAAGKVAERVAAYERRMTENSPVTPTRKSSVHQQPASRDAERPRTKNRTRIEYSFAQRPEFFIANPDGRTSPSL